MTTTRLIAAVTPAGRYACGDAECRRPAGAPARHHAGAMLDALLLLVAFVRATVRGRSELAVENLLLRQQLAVLTRPTRKRPRLRRCDKLFWVLARLLWRRWSQHLVVVQPESVVRRHRQGWKLYWRWKSRPRLGRPRLSAEVRELIAVMARDNPRWGSERIRGELLKLGIVVCKRSIQRYRRRQPMRPPSQTWRTVLANHALSLWAADLLTVHTIAFKTLYALLFITHGRRELVHVTVTAHPTAAWVWRQLIEATAWGRRPTHLVRDRDAVYGGDFVPRATALGIQTVLTPVRAPRANAIAKRVMGTIRRECVDHLLIVNEAHLRAVLNEYVAFSNRDRLHRSLILELPQGPPSTVPFAAGPIRSRPVLSGLHHVYERAA
ncbi:MAG: integrase core domain-containing protein [Chloroflexota bacterium]|nr:integrase core domain-containing protein [Chloroflexota bacterium]